MKLKRSNPSVPITWEFRNNNCLPLFPPLRWAHKWT